MIFLSEVLARSARRQQRPVRFLFRGDSYSRLLGRFVQNFSTQSSDMQVSEEFLKRFFIIGDKAKHFWAHPPCSDGHPKPESALNSLDDVSDDSFRKILGNLQLAINEVKNLVANKGRRRLAEFLGNHHLLIGCLESEIENLVSKYSSLDHSNKLSVRNTFLCLLHTISRKELPHLTPFISTTFEWDEARSHYANDKEGAVIQWVFLPENADLITCDIDKFKEHSRALPPQGFPPIVSGFYKDSKEVAWYGGLPPHFVIGLEFCTSRSFYVNPALFDAQNRVRNIEDCTAGLPVDQESFEQFIGDSGFKSWIERSGSIYREEAV